MKNDIDDFAAELAQTDFDCTSAEVTWIFIQDALLSIFKNNIFCEAEERQILNRWTEYCPELYNYKANGDPSVLNCTQMNTEDDHPILRREVEAAVQSLKKGKSAGVNNI